MYQDYSKIRLLSAILGSSDDIRVKKKSGGTSWIRYILAISVAILIIVFIALSYVGYEIMDQARFLYNKPLEWDYSSIISLDIVQRTKPKPFFIKHPIAKDLQCAQMYGDNSKEYIQNLILPIKNVSYAKSRIKYKDEKDLKTDCDSIKNRSYFPVKPRTDFEAKFPLAFVRIVYTDYLFLEMELAASYTPQNSYCYMIDKKANKIFHDRIHNLTKCFPNVIATTQEYKVDSAGHNMWPAFVECLYALQKFKWRYAMLLQNHDIVAKINYELVQIFTWFNGANDVQIGNPMMGRIDTKLNWTFEGLNLFRNASKNLIGAHGLPPKLNWAKGYVESSLSREMVDFMTIDLNLTKLMRQIEAKSFGIDEIMLPTLQATDALDAPGGFTHACLDKGIGTSHITRFSVWYDKANCPTKYLRHAICIFGLEDLERLTKIPKLFINKFMPTIDFGALTCWYERLFNRTYLEEPTAEKLDKNVYLSLRHVRFQNEKLKSNGTFTAKKFNCTG